MATMTIYDKQQIDRKINTFSFRTEYWITWNRDMRRLFVESHWTDWIQISCGPYLGSGIENPLELLKSHDRAMVLCLCWGLRPSQPIRVIAIG